MKIFPILLLFIGLLTYSDELNDAYKAEKNHEPLKAFELFKRSCDKNNKEGCWRVGWAYAKGQGTESNKNLSLIYFNKGCDLHNGESCFMSGIYDEDIKSFQSASQKYEKGCLYGDFKACLSAGEMYEKGKGIRQNFKIAKEYFGKACDIGNQYGCDEYRKLNVNGI